MGRALPLLLLAAVAAAGCGASRRTPATAAARHATASGCAAVSAPPAQQRTAPKPTRRLDPAKTYDVTLRTSCGSFTVRLAVTTSPAATASFVALVRRGFFDRTIFHRIVPGFVVQGGDPTATGTGGPGYTTVDRPPRSTRYTLGVVAMAKTAAQPAGTSGSQFFVVTARNAGLPPEYAVLGRVVRGLAVVERIGRFGDPASLTGAPTRIVEIERATVAVR
ncbi:MAG TPA: peptidylprolyl isomerase [Gaiellaceae bacterium]|nr:peptidylprolyl isomerase [Gaiellaceae bacterium]